MLTKTTLFFLSGASWRRRIDAPIVISGRFSAPPSPFTQPQPTVLRSLPLLPAAAVVWFTQRCCCWADNKKNDALPPINHSPNRSHFSQLFVILFLSLSEFRRRAKKEGGGGDSRNCFPFSYGEVGEVLVAVVFVKLIFGDSSWTFILIHVIGLIVWIGSTSAAVISNLHHTPLHALCNSPKTKIRTPLHLFAHSF